MTRGEADGDEEDYGPINIVSSKGMIVIPPPIQMIKQDSKDSDISGCEEVNEDEQDGRYTINSILQYNSQGDPLSNTLGSS